MWVGFVEAALRDSDCGIVGINYKLKESPKKSNGVKLLDLDSQFGSPRPRHDFTHNLIMDIN